MTQERANELLPIITAFAEGKMVEWFSCGSWTLAPEPKWDDNVKYRIKPEPLLRPWNPEEMPVGAVVKSKSNPTLRRIIMATEVDGTPVLGGYGSIHASTLLENWMLDDGKPCGVVEE